MAIHVGLLLRGYCNGYFGNSHDPKRVEAVGADWVVARESRSGIVLLATGSSIHEWLIKSQLAEGQEDED